MTTDVIGRIVGLQYTPVRKKTSRSFCLLTLTLNLALTLVLMLTLCLLILTVYAEYCRKFEKLSRMLIIEPGICGTIRHCNNISEYY